MKRPTDWIDDSAARLIKLKAPRICRKCGLPPSEVEMIEQMLRLHLWLIRDSLGPLTDSPGRAAFVDVALNNRGVSIIREFRSQKRNGGCSIPSLDDPDLELEPVDEPDEDQEDLRFDLEALLDVLTPRQRELIEAMQSRTLKALAKKPGWSRRQVIEQRKQLKQACIDRGLDIYL